MGNPRSHQEAAPKGIATAQTGGSVLLCYDGSYGAQRAIRSAAALLRPRAAIVLHVRDGDGAASLAESGAGLARRNKFAPVSTIEGDGESTVDTILEKAHEHHVALIVVGSESGSAIGASLLGSVSSAVVHRADIPVLVVRPQKDPETADESGPTFVCYDGSEEARRAIDAAAGLLAERDAIVASFLDPVEDVAQLRKSLPWPPLEETDRRLAELDRGEAEFIAQRSTEGAQVATSRGLASRPLTIEAHGSAWRRLLDIAATSAASCIVVGHRRTAAVEHHSTAYGLVHHASRPVLVVPSRLA
jgi:nucleotide-binding universal stress UspA family protein